MLLDKDFSIVERIAPAASLSSNESLPLLGVKAMSLLAFFDEPSNENLNAFAVDPLVCIKLYVGTLFVNFYCSEVRGSLSWQLLLLQSCLRRQDALMLHKEANSLKFHLPLAVGNLV